MKEPEEEQMSYYRKRWLESARKEMDYEQQKKIFFRLKQQIRLAGKSKDKRFTIPQWAHYAAAILLCVAMGISSYLYVNNSKTIPGYKEYTVTADKGQRASVVLPDGTKVWLNSHTNITYSNDYATDKRIVALKGEAYFEVAKDSLHPFLVRAGGMEVEALGTSFNVKAYEEDSKIVATLFTGKLRTTAGGKETILLPDQYAQFNKENQTLQTSNTTNTSYARMWMDNELAFESNTMEEITTLLNRMYNVNIVFQTENIKQYRFSGVIKNNSLDNVIEIISLTVPIEYRSDGDTIYIKRK